jgi:hypothetical protein
MQTSPKQKEENDQENSQTKDSRYDEDGLSKISGFVKLFFEGLIG